MSDEPASTIVQEGDIGQIRLAVSFLDVMLGLDGHWRGENAQALNDALANATGFSWPRRLRGMKMHNAVVVLGDVHKPEAREVLGSFTHRLAECWPVAERQSHIPPVVPFRILAKTGARIQAQFLHEFE